MDFPNLLIQRAIYDRSRNALVVTTRGGEKKSGVSSFEIRGLDPTAAYSLSAGDEAPSRFKGKGAVSVEVDLGATQDVVLVAERD